MNLYKVEVLAEECLRHLEKAKQGECWCPKGIGHPLVSDHLEDCKNISKFIKRLQGVVNEFTEK